MAMHKCPNCELEFKYHKGRDVHKKVCVVYGGPIDKRRKNEYTKACEASERIDGTLTHASGIFHALLALPKEQRKNITIDNVENTVVITQIPEEIIETPSETTLLPSGSSKIINYHLQITNNTQNIQNTKIVNNSFTQETLNQLCERSNTNTIKQSGDKDINEVIEALCNENIDTPDKIQAQIKKVLTFDEVQDTIATEEDDSRIGNEMKKFIEKILLSTTNTIESVDEHGNKIPVNEIKNSPSECIWLFYRKIFLSEESNGKTKAHQLARRNTNLQSNESCKVLAFKKVNGRDNVEHAVWDIRKWNTLIKKLIHVIGERISVVFQTAKLSRRNQCHPFGDWWSCIKGADDLEKDVYGIQLIKKITNAVVLDCKESLISGWHKLIDCCGQLHFDTISTTLAGLKALETDEKTLTVEEEYEIIKKRQIEYLQAPEFKVTGLLPEDFMKEKDRIEGLMESKKIPHNNEREEIIRDSFDQLND